MFPGISELLDQFWVDILLERRAGLISGIHSFLTLSTLIRTTWFLLMPFLIWFSLGGIHYTAMHSFKSRLWEPSS